jgi:hypothetical protein
LPPPLPLPLVPVLLPQPWLHHRSTAAALLLHQAIASLLSNVPQQELAQPLQAHLPCDLAAAGALSGLGSNQQPGGGSRRDVAGLKAAAAAAAGQPLWAVVSQLLLHAIGALPQCDAGTSGTKQELPTAADGMVVLFGHQPDGSSAGGSASCGAAAVDRRDQLEGSLLRCLAWCCAGKLWSARACTVQLDPVT